MNEPHIEPVRVVQNFMSDTFESLLRVPPSLWNDDNISLLAQLAEKHKINTCDINSNENLLMYLLAVDKNVHGFIQKYQLLQEIMENQTQNATLLEEQLPALERILTIIHNGHHPSLYMEDLSKEITRFVTIKFVVQKNDAFAKQLMKSYKPKPDKKSSQDSARLYKAYESYKTPIFYTAMINLQKCHRLLLINIQDAIDENNRHVNLTEEVEHMDSVVLHQYESMKGYHQSRAENKTRRSRSKSQRNTRSRK
jgi:hypothetical protein|uniref:Uncharacterized protein n=1 Tax=viral metagenome TaxID=1070528 RepID=A0A6C0DXM9_9ZZZZ